MIRFLPNRSLRNPEEMAIGALVAMKAPVRRPNSNAPRCASIIPMVSSGSSFSTPFRARTR